MITADQIRKVIHEHSGGIKFLHLIAALSEFSELNDVQNVVNPDELLTLLESMKPEIEVLHYSWKMGGDELSREKLFVYTP